MCVLSQQCPHTLPHTTTNRVSLLSLAHLRAYTLLITVPPWHTLPILQSGAPAVDGQVGFSGVRGEGGGAVQSALPLREVQFLGSKSLITPVYNLADATVHKS